MEGPEEEGIEDFEGGKIRSWRLVLYLITLALFVSVWQFSPLREWLTLGQLASLNQIAEPGILSLVVVLTLFVLGSLLVVPITLMLTATAFAFGPVTSVLYSILGCFLASVVTFLLGRKLGKQSVQRFLGTNALRMSQKLGQEGFLAVIASRMLPLGPFTFVNLVAGVSHIRFKDFAVGTVIGMLPGILVISIFEEQLRSAIKNPTLPTILVLLGIAVGFALLVLFIRTKLKE